jgi:hypothetical protein
VSEVAGRGLGKAHVSVSGAWASTNPPEQAGRFHRGLPAASQGLEPAFLMGVADVFDEAEDLLVGRHRDYGPGNIANGYPDPLTALVVRMGDKMERIKNLLSSDHPVFGERMRDSWMDLANYGLIGVMVIDGKWPGVKGKP